MNPTPGQAITKYYNRFDGGVNGYIGVRQVKDNEAVDGTINCDFRGRSGVGNRQGYTEVGTPGSLTAGYGISTFTTAALKQVVKFASNGANVLLSYGTGSGWTDVSTTTFTNSLPVYPVQAGGKLFFPNNGTDNMCTWDGSSIASYAAGAKVLYPVYYDRRLVGIDPANLDTIKFSTQYGDATKSLDFTTDGTTSKPFTHTIMPGAGTEIRGLAFFKNYLYIFCYPLGIFRAKPHASTANEIVLDLVTKAVGCVSNRSIVQVGEDLFFAADDGVYSLGDVANFSDVRTTNKSARLQRVFDGLTAAGKRQLAAEYFNFKYHLFYPLTGGANDACAVFDVRYQGWHDWRSMAAADATVYVDASGEQHLYFIEPSTGKVQELYAGTTDNGVKISSRFRSKSFDDGMPDLMKKYRETTFVFGALNGTANVSAVFDDTQVSAAQPVSQNRPQGGFGRDAFGVRSFGDATNTTTVRQVVSVPQRLRARSDKFAIGYEVTSTDDWQLDAISQFYKYRSRNKFPSANKLN